MRAIWKGAVSFGLVSISVKLYAATEEKSIRFHQVHREDGGRIRYQRVCSVCGTEVSYDEIAKGYDIGGGEIVILDDADLEDLPLSTSRAIDVLEFVPADQVDPIFYAHAYYLEPESSATKPYVLLRDALTGSERVAIVKITLRQREQLATLRVRGGVLVLNTMLWPDEVRQPDFGFLDSNVGVRSQELAMATSLVDSMAGDFDPDVYTDDYREALQQVIDAKISGREIVAQPEQAPKTAGVVDLMSALRASVERARAARGESSGESSEAPDAEREPAEPTPITRARSAKNSAAAPAATRTSPARTRATRTPAAEPAPRKAPAKSTAASTRKSADRSAAGSAPGSAAEPAAQPASKPASKPAARSAAMSTTEPTTSAATSAAKSATRSTARSTTRSSSKAQPKSSATRAAPAKSAALKSRKSA